MLLTLFVVSVCSWQSAWADDVEVTVTLSAPGGLGNEVLTYMSTNLTIESPKLSDVTSLTVTGPMNDEDWNTLHSFSSLKTLNLTNVNCENMPDNQFDCDFYDNNCRSLESVSLPGNLRTIGEDAFIGQTNLQSVTIPSTVETVGDQAFYGCTNLETLDGGWPSSAVNIPNGCFGACFKLQPFDIPDEVETIGNSAFHNCYLFGSDMPTSLKAIGETAFSGCAMTNVEVVIPEGAVISGGAFQSSGIISLTLPTTYYKANNIVSECNSLTNVTFKSITMVENAIYFYSSSTADNITLHVPSIMVASYQSNSYWGRYKNIVGFDISTITDWTIQNTLNLGTQRLNDNSNVVMTENSALTISGETSQIFGNFSTAVDYEYANNPEDWNYSLIMSDCANVSVSGIYTHSITANPNYWYFLCLPFDFAVSDITTEGNKKFAIRYYDGANRANGASNNWKDYQSEDEVPAGTGFIIRVSDETTITFKAKSNTSRNNAFKNTEITTSLDANDSENAVDKGWNLVGNPWQCYFNIHELNYTAPISVYRMSNDTYTAYSIEDDNYAILPNQAFFVQCPGGDVSSIGFPVSGRQLTSTVTSARKHNLNSDRKIFELQVESNGRQDKTRLVVNEAAQLGYELTCDASKIIAEGSLTPQIFSQDADGTQYAINERPEADGSLAIGIIVPEDGQYTLSAIRNNLGKVVLTDHETGIETDLQKSDYTFAAFAGQTGGRFTISFGGNATGISTVKNAEEASIEVFTLDGKMVGNSTNGLKKGVYMVRKGQQTQKVLVK